MENNKLESYLQGVAVQQYKSDIGFRTLVESVNDNMYIIPKYQRKFPSFGSTDLRNQQIFDLAFA